MPIVPPELDDLRFDRSVEELVRRIPVYSPEWTDHNDSDPGITLIQLFAHLAEQVGYRLNRVPEKNHVELLKLLGIRLRPARAARTRLAFLLSDPATTAGFTLTRGARARGKTGNPPPVFETDDDVDIVPTEPNLLLTTKNPVLWDLRRTASGAEDPLATVPDPVPNDDTEWLTIAWDGKKPKLKDMPLEPVAFLPREGHRYLWIALDFNEARDAGFLGTRVSLHVQFDDDEQPSLTATESCQARVTAESAPPRVEWLHYYDVAARDLRPIPGRIDDSTDRLTHSGGLRFTVPFTFGAIPESAYRNLREATDVSPLDACLAFGRQLQTDLAPAPGPVTLPLQPLQLADYQAALTKAISAVETEAGEAKPPIGHLLDPKHRDPRKSRGWLRITLTAPSTAAERGRRLRMVTFNAASATNATTVTGELLGRADGRPAQSFRLAHGNVLERTLEVGIQEDAEATLTVWREIPSLDTATHRDSVFEFDAEAGTLLFGDGQRGRIPPLVPRAGSVVALRYRHGGGKAGETGVATITALESQRVGLAAVTNVVAATGGRDAETLEEAKRRARKELSTRSRAVTAGDFEWIAGDTPGVRVARAHIVPLRRPLPQATTPAAIAAPRCGPPLPAGPSGLDAIVAAGAVAVVVVPDEEGPEPVPTPSFLRRVCEHLDRHRLVTTEVHVVPPQYLRLCNMVVNVKAAPGLTRATLQERVERRLATYLHVLRGGEAGKGFPFGGQLHTADLVAQVFRVEGVDRVELLIAEFSRTKSNAAPRQGRLVLCPTGADDVEEIQLAPEENVSFDPTRLTLSTVV